MTDNQSRELLGKNAGDRAAFSGTGIGALKDELRGALIGVARASESNPLVNGGTYDILIGGLAAAGAPGDKDNNGHLHDDGIDEAHVLRLWISRVREERHRLVPRCSACANPCGRTEEYDIKAARLKEPAGLVLKKHGLLKELERLAGLGLKGGRTDAIDGFFAWALFEIGYEETEEGMGDVLTALDSVRASLKR